MTELLILIWITSGLIGYGIQVNVWDTKYPPPPYEGTRDRIFSAFVSFVGGPFALFVTILFSFFTIGKIGWRL